MRWLCKVLLLFLFSGVLVSILNAEDTAEQAENSDSSDNDFAEFETEGDEEEEDEEEAHVDEEHDNDIESDTDPAVDNEEEDEFDHFNDEEEFEGYNKDKLKKQDQPDLKIAKVPVHLRANWESFYMEILTIAGLAAYALNFFMGRNKNSRLATAWLKGHRKLLEDNFSVVGDDGTGDEPLEGILMKESESLYTLWCSGRVGIEGLLVEIKLLKRHDLLHVLSHMVKPTTDSLIITVNMKKEEMDNFVFAVVPKKASSRLVKDMQDLNLYCQDFKRNGDKYGLPSSYTVISESHEIAGHFLSTKVANCITSFEGLFEYMHISDQYIGPKPDNTDNQEEEAERPKPQKVMIFRFTIPGKGGTRPADMATCENFMKFVLYCIEQCRKFRLSREGKAKSEKKRREVEENVLKQSHLQRQEAAQARAEEKRRIDREKLLQEDDPEKSRRLEVKEHKKDMKKRNPLKIKQLKI